MSAGDLIATGVLLLLGGGAIAINHNRKVECHLCGTKLKNGNMKKIKDVADEQFSHLGWRGERFDSIDIIAKTRLFIGMNLDDVLRKSNEARNNHKEPVGNQKVCDDCIVKINETLKTEAERLKVHCTECDKIFWEYDLDVPHKRALPDYWIIPSDFEKKVCSDCRHKIENREIERWRQIQVESKAFEKGEEYEWHPINHLGSCKKIIDESTIKDGIKTSSYRDKNDALSYLWERAYYEGYNIIFNVKFEKDTEGEQAPCLDDYESPNHVRGVHLYSVYSATGDFAKKKK